jgi:hypothetical protein
MSLGRIIECARCHDVTRNHGRRLCSRCHSGERAAGTLDRWPAGKWRGAGGLALAHPDGADPIVIDQAVAAVRAGRPVHVRDDYDRGGIVALVAAGQLGRTEASRALHCSSSTLRRYLAALPELPALDVEDAA